MSTELHVIRELLTRLQSENISYCHWKSNEKLGASLQGDTDLDILFNRSQKADVQRILMECGFLRFDSVSAVKYDGIVDYLGVDPETTKVVHVHAHFMLTVGERYLKSYHLPWESELLSSRYFDEEWGIYVADPHFELILLLVRDSLKFRKRDLLKLYMKNEWMTRNSARELEWLIERVDHIRLSGMTECLLGQKANSLSLEMLTRPTPRRVHKFIGEVRRRVRIYRSMSAIRALVSRWGREIRSCVLRSMVKVLDMRPSWPTRRRRTNKGVVIAIIGTDGSGKSTAVASATEWLRTKIDVLPIYLGSGKGNASLLRGPLKLIRSHWSQRRKKGKYATKYNTNSTHHRNSGFQLKTLFNVLWATLLVIERKRKLARAWRARGRGMIVVSDRFPQAQEFGSNDGPLLFRYAGHSNRLLKKVVQWELEQYKALSMLYQPDKVIRLQVHPEVAAMRRLGMSSEQSRQKQSILFGVEWAVRTEVVTVDANRPLQEVTHDVRTEIWRSISSAG